MEETGSVSVIEPIGEAMDWMQERVFDPFKVGEWFVFGFAWFLAGLAQFGSNVGFPSGPTGGGDVGGGPPGELSDEISTFLSPTVIAVVIAGFLIGFAILALLLWLGSRGSFIFLDSTLREEAAISEPWSEYSALGNSLFRVRLLYSVVTAFIGLLFVGAGIAGFVLLQDGGMSAAFITFFVILLLFAVPLFFAFALFYQILDDFVVQIMYRRDMYCWEATKLFWNEILSQYPGTFILFYLMKFILSIGAGFIIFIGGCLTCCIGFIPYLQNVIFLPIGVFFRTYSIRMLAQFGNEWSVDVRDEAVAELF